MRVSHVAAVLGLLVLRGAASATEAPPLPPPGMPGSHERYVEALRAANEDYAEDLLARYERRLAEAPDDVVAAVERCRFLASAFYDPEEDENPREDEATACVEDLGRRFADDPAVRVYAIEERWGDEAREAGEAFLAEPPQGTTPAQLAAVHAHLSRASDDVDHAEQAMALDPSLDLRVFVAEARLDEGNRERAREVLLPGLLETPGDFLLERKAALLADAGAFAAAVSAFRELERRGAEPWRWAAYGRALAGAGELDAARAAFAKLDDVPAANAESRRARFEFELAHGDARAARAAYDALRDLGFEEDALGSTRFALLLAYPGAPWRWRDATGFALFAALAFGIALLPALWILPVAWAGLGRERAAAAPGGFTLRQAWTVSAAFLVAETLTLLALAGVISEGFDASWPTDPASVARSTVAGSALSAAAVLLVVRGRVRGLFARGAWSWRRTLLAALLLTATLGAGELLFTHLVDGEAAVEAAMETVRALNATYGLATALLLLALVVPIVEEVMFRGVILSAFARHLSPRWANLAQATLFGLAHVEPIAIPFSFALGLVAGWTVRRTGTLWTALGVHALGNAYACIASASGG